MASDIINNSYAIGIAGKNLILQTAGRVYVKRQDKYYELNFGNAVSKSGEEIPTLPDIIVVNTEKDILNMDYPGDGRIIISKDGSLYITDGSQKIKWDSNSSGGGQPINSTTINGQLTINYPNGSPFIINSKELVYNLNAEFLNGFQDSDFTKKIENEIITGSWTFGDINLTGSLGNDYTYLNMETSTLVVDNLIVRNNAQIPGENEGIISYKIFGTNEETWVSKEFFISSMIIIPPLNVPNPSPTIDEFTGDYYRANVIGYGSNGDPIDLSIYISKDTVVKSDEFYYKVVDLAPGILYLRSLPSLGKENELKLVSVGNTYDVEKSGGITMNSILDTSPYLDVTDSYKYAPLDSNSKLTDNENITLRIGNLNGLADNSSFGTFSGYGAFFNKNTYILNPDISYGNNRFNRDGSGNIGEFSWGANGNGIATTSLLGTIKVGSGLNVASDGTISTKPQLGEWMNITMQDYMPTAIADCGNHLKVIVGIGSGAGASTFTDIPLNLGSTMCVRVMNALSASASWITPVKRSLEPATYTNLNSSDAPLLRNIEDVSMSGSILTVTLASSITVEDRVTFWLPMRISM